MLWCFGVVTAAYHSTVTHGLQHRHASSVSLVAGLASTEWVVSEGAARLLQVSTPLASQVLFLSPLHAMEKFREEGTRDASALPYAAMVANGAAWCAYGASAPSTPDMTILLGNAGGVAFGLYYCYTFYKHMSPGSDGPMLFAGALSVVVASLAAAATLPVQTVHDVAGFAGVGFCVLMFSGPLASVQVILRSCSASSLPMGFTLATVLNCVLWCTYGAAVIHDPLVWGPNGAGLVASATQLGLYSKYGGNEEGCDLYEEGSWLPPQAGAR